MRIGFQTNINRPERIFQNPAGRKAASGQIKKEQPSSAPQKRITLQGREGSFKPLVSLSGDTLLNQASQSALDVASGANLPSMVTSRFAPAEFLMLNSGDYHGAEHPVKVAKATETFAKNAGISKERAEFLRDVSLLHDADERILMDGNGNYSYADKGVKARVPVTLAFMDLNQDALQERMGWSKGEFQEAKALIAGTEHPLNDNVGAGRINNLPDYDGKSAAGVLKEQLIALPKERQSQVLEELQIMRFADQSAEYLDGVESARTSVKDLASELEVVPYDALLKGTPNFIDGLGKDNEAFADLPVQTGRALITELGLEGQARIFTPQELHGFMSSDQSRTLAEVKENISR